jgi:hypothetical protein
MVAMANSCVLSAKCNQCLPPAVRVPCTSSSAMKRSLYYYPWTACDMAIFQQNE